MINNLKQLTTEEKTRRIREAMVWLLECKRTYFADVYSLAVKMAREVFGVTDMAEWYTIGCAVAKSYTDAHGQPEH